MSDTVICQVCGKEMRCVNPSHLRLHGVTMKEYRDKFPDSPLVTDEGRRTRGTGMENRYKWLTYGGKEPDELLKSFFCGTLLGDGHIEKNVHTARYREGGKNQEYMWFKYHLLKLYFPTTLKHRVSKPDKRTNKQYEAWWLSTSYHPFLSELHDMWYKSRKVVPFAFVEEHLDAFALSMWFFDDGHLDRHGCRLYTMAFSESEVEFLQHVLLTRFKVRASIWHNKKHQPSLNIPAADKEKFLGIVCQFALPGMEYKSTHPIHKRRAS